MKAFRISLILFAAAAFVNGCCTDKPVKVHAADTVSLFPPVKKNNVQKTESLLPPALPDPSNKPPAAEKTENNSPRKASEINTACDANKKSLPPPKPECNNDSSKKPPRSPENFRKGAGIWRAYSRLNTKEQREILEIQRKDPERFRKIMQQKADALYEAERKNREELDALVKKIRSSDNITERNELKQILRKKIKAGFMQRLQDSRRDIESHKKRLVRMETELQKREKNCDAIVDAILEQRLHGK